MKKFRVFDCHCDTAYELMTRGESIEHNSCHISLQRASQLAGYAQFFAFCTYGSMQGKYGQSELLYQKQMEIMQRQIEIYENRMALCRTPDDVERIMADGRVAVLLSIEGAEGIHCDPGKLELAKEQGISMTTLTWNGNNDLAGYHETKHGLSAKGKEFVRRAQHLGIIIDTSHISERAFWDICEIAERPIVASHSNSAARCNCSRNLTDRQFLAICELGGTVGLNLYGPFLTEGSATFEDIYVHLDHFLQLGGEGHISLGGDLDGCDILPQGFSGVDNYNQLADFLLSRGIPEATLQDVFFDAVLRVMKACNVSV